MKVSVGIFGNSFTYPGWDSRNHGAEAAVAPVADEASCSEHGLKLPETGIVDDGHAVGRGERRSRERKDRGWCGSCAMKMQWTWLVATRGAGDYDVTCFRRWRFVPARYGNRGRHDDTSMDGHNTFWSINAGLLSGLQVTAGGEGSSALMPGWRKKKKKKKGGVVFKKNKQTGK